VAELTRRLQVLLDEPRWKRLETQAQSRGTSVATLIREAIDQVFPGSEPTAAEAAGRFLARGPLDIGDWADAKTEIEQGLSRGPSA
jgi:hypothetical protein